MRLRLTGELDLASAPVLRRRLARLRARRRSVRLDLSVLAFMDCSGLRLLMDTFADAEADGWCFEVDANLSPQVARVFKLTDLQPPALQAAGQPPALVAAGTRTLAQRL